MPLTREYAFSKEGRKNEHIFAKKKEYLEDIQMFCLLAYFSGEGMVPPPLFHCSPSSSDASCGFERIKHRRSSPPNKAMRISLLSGRTGRTGTTVLPNPGASWCTRETYMLPLDTLGVVAT